MKSRYFYLSLTLVITSALIISAMLVSHRSKDTVEELYYNALMQNAELTSFKVKRYIEDRAIVLQDIAQGDVLTSAIMGSQTTTAGMYDYFEEYRLIGDDVPIFAFDFTGEIIYQRKFESDHPFNTEDTWFSELMIGSRELVVLPYIDGKNIYFSIAVPITYNDLPEGVLIAILPTTLSKIVSTLEDKENQYAHIYGPYFDHGSTVDTSNFEVLLESPIENTPLKLEYLINSNFIESKTHGFIFDILLAIVVSLFFAFIILSIAGRKYLLNPYLELKQSQDDLIREQELNVLLSQAIDASPVGVTIADIKQPDQPLTYVNDYFCTLTGYEKNEVIGNNCRFLQGKETNKEARRIIKKAMRPEKKSKLNF